MNANTTDTLTAKIDTITAKIAASPYTEEQSADAAAALVAMMSSGNVDVSEFVKLAAVAELNADLETLRQYEETAAADLMKVESRYVITDTPAIASPAGFSFADRVFIQTTIAIHTDTPAAPQSNVRLYVHDVDAIAANA